MKRVGFNLILDSGRSISTAHGEPTLDERGQMHPYVTTEGHLLTDDERIEVAEYMKGRWWTLGLQLRAKKAFG